MEDVTSVEFIIKTGTVKALKGELSGKRYEERGLGKVSTHKKY